MGFCTTTGYAHQTFGPPHVFRKMILNRSDVSPFLKEEISCCRNNHERGYGTQVTGIEMFAYLIPAGLMYYLYCVYEQSLAIHKRMRKPVLPNTKVRNIEA